MIAGYDMPCAPCTCSPAPVAACLPTSSSDTRQLLLWSGIHTPARFCGRELRTDGSQTCTCGRETFGCSIHPNTPAAWIASMRDSLAKICHSLGIDPDSAKAREAGYTGKCSESLAWYDPDTCSWRTWQQSFLEGLALYSEIWPRAGMIVAGVAWRHRESERRINATGGGALPRWRTPVASDAASHVMGRRDSRGAPQLSAQVMMWPTPSVNGWKGGSMAGQRRGQLTDPAMGAIPAGGKLNPTWVEWLMGWPLGWTASRHWATARCRSRRPLRGKSSEVNE